MIPWAHTDRTDLTGFLCGWEISRMLYGLWFFVGSHGFCEIQREDYLWKFVKIRVRKNTYLIH